MVLASTILHARILTQRLSGKYAPVENNPERRSRLVCVVLPMPFGTAPTAWGNRCGPFQKREDWPNNQDMTWPFFGLLDTQRPTNGYFGVCFV